MADNESATSSGTAIVTADVPKLSETKRWADVADEEAEQERAEASSADINIDSLAIDESKLDNPLTDPDDSRIEAVTSGDTPYTSAKKFEDLDLSPELLKRLYIEMKFEKPSKIQVISLPMILNPPYKNLITQAHNGFGKTTCFLLGMLSRVDPKIIAPQALCICPTRELAIQDDVIHIHRNWVPSDCNYGWEISQIDHEYIDLGQKFHKNLKRKLKDTESYGKVEFENFGDKVGISLFLDKYMKKDMLVRLSINWGF